MSGRESLRGYLVQTMVSLLDALRIDNTWEAVSLEPVHESEKVDVTWHYHDHNKVVQIKSSQNPFHQQKIKDWCTELRNSTNADQYELLLVGNLASGSDMALREFEGVCIPAPQPLDVEGMLANISSSLSTYCTRRMIPVPQSLVGRILASALVFQLEVESIYGQLITKGAFDELLERWIFTLVPYIRDLDPTADFAAIRRAINSQTFQPESWVQPLQLIKIENHSHRGISLLDALNKNNKIILVGNSGTGKTYAMRMAANELPRDSHDLCFWIPLVSYTRNLDYTLKRLLGWYDLQEDKVIPVLQQHQVTLLFDGLNEVTEGEREQCAREIQQLLYAYQGKLCISYPLSDYTYFDFVFPTYKISPLTKEQIEHAIAAFFTAEGESQKATWFFQTIRGWDSERQLSNEN